MSAAREPADDEKAMEHTEAHQGRPPDKLGWGNGEEGVYSDFTPVYTSEVLWTGEDMLAEAEFID